MKFSGWYIIISFGIALLTIFYYFYSNKESLDPTVNYKNELHQKNNVMQAVVINKYGEPNVLEITSRPIPTFTAKQALIKVAAAGINCMPVYVNSIKKF